MSRALLAAAGLLAAATWLASAPLPGPARAFLVVLVAVVPLLAVAQVAPAESLAGPLPRIPVYLSSAAAIWALAALALLAAHASGFGARRLGLVWPGTGPFLGWSAAATVAALGLVVLGRALRLRESALLRQLIPRTRREKLAFVGLALSAGIGEELVFRGFLVPALEAVLGSVAAAAVAGAVVFGISHAYQSVSGAVRAGVLGGLLTVPFLLSGSIFPSMAAHAALDVVAGVWLARWLLDR